MACTCSDNAPGSRDAIFLLARIGYTSAQACAVVCAARARPVAIVVKGAVNPGPPPL